MVSIMFRSCVFVFGCVALCQFLFLHIIVDLILWLAVLLSTSIIFCILNQLFIICVCVFVVPEEQTTSYRRLERFDSKRSLPNFESTPGFPPTNSSSPTSSGLPGPARTVVQSELNPARICRTLLVLNGRFQNILNSIVIGFLPA